MSSTPTLPQMVVHVTDEQVEPLYDCDAGERRAARMRVMVIGSLVTAVGLWILCIPMLADPQQRLRGSLVLVSCLMVTVGTVMQTWMVRDFARKQAINVDITSRLQRRDTEIQYTIRVLNRTTEPIFDVRFGPEGAVLHPKLDPGSQLVGTWSEDSDIESVRTPAVTFTDRRHRRWHSCNSSLKSDTQIRERHSAT